MVAPFAEKDFYLEEFRGRTLVIAADRAILRGLGARRKLVSVVDDLIGCGARVVVVLGHAADPAPSSPAPPLRGEPAAAWRRWLGLPRTRARRSRSGGSSGRSDVVSWPEPAAASRSADDERRGLAAVWRILRVRPLALVVGGEPAMMISGRVASGLRVSKLVLVDRAGGLVNRRTGARLSYLDGASLDALLAAGEAEFQGFGDRRELLGEVDAVLERGVSAVNLCTVQGLARELFTYEGSGTFISRDEHCRVGPLSVDDFSEVERLIARGQKEGLLKSRSVEEVAEVLLTGFGVWLGEGHLAGAGSLRTWRRGRRLEGEITALYTFTRFKGEGIGGRLVARLVDEARRRKMKTLFAVTISERAAKFFVRQGFSAARRSDVPAEKWVDYETGREARVRVFRLVLS